MKNIVIIFGFLLILCVALIGCLYIFEVKTLDESFELFTKVGGAIVFLGVCSAAIKLLTGSGKGPQE